MHEMLNLVRTLTDVGFCVFLCTFHDIMQSVRPMGKVIQGLVEPSEFVGAVRRMLAAMSLKRRVAVELRRILQVTALLGQHLTGEERWRLVRALFGSKFALCFPTLGAELGGIIYSEQPMFRGVNLQVISQADRADHVILGPHCQCQARADYHEKWRSSSGLPREAKLVTVPFHFPTVTEQRREAQHVVREIRVPRWVWSGRDAALHKDDSPGAFAIRHHAKTTGTTTPGLHTAAMFRAHIDNRFEHARARACNHKLPRRLAA